MELVGGGSVINWAYLSIFIHDIQGRGMSEARQEYVCSIAARCLHNFYTEKKQEPMFVCGFCKNIPR